MAAVVELATIVKARGGRADLFTDGDIPHGVGRITEFRVGGSHGNARTAAHLESLLPGVRIEPVGADLKFTTGGAIFRREPGAAQYVVLGRAWGPGEGPGTHARPSRLAASCRRPGSSRDPWAHAMA